jgi:hypothetical protein
MAVEMWKGGCEGDAGDVLRDGVEIRKKLRERPGPNESVRVNGGLYTRKEGDLTDYPGREVGRCGPVCGGQAMDSPWRRGRCVCRGRAGIVVGWMMRTQG